MADSPMGEDLLTRLRGTSGWRRRIELLTEVCAGDPAPAGGILDAAPEAAIATDEALGLAAVYHCHVTGRHAERDYYLSALPDGAARREVRQALSIAAEFPPGRLVFLVTVDCLRADHLSCNGYGVPTTPALDRMAEEGLNFPRAFSTASQTAQSFPGILLSNFFQNLGGGITVPEGLTSLAQVMSASGFHTTALNAANPLVSHYCRYDRGFDDYDDFLLSESAADTDACDLRSRKALNELTEAQMMAVVDECQAHPDVYQTLQQVVGLAGIKLVRRIAADRDIAGFYDAGELFRALLENLQSNRGAGDHFYWLHLMDAHEPITVPFSRLGSYPRIVQFLLNHCVQKEHMRGVLGPGGEAYVRLYDHSVSYVDMHMAVLRNFLEDHGLYESSLICFTADHGQQLMEAGAFGHGYSHMLESVLNVPLVFGGGLASRIDRSDSTRAVSTLDIAPTILDVCGVDERPATFLGTTLNDTAPRRVYGQCVPILNPWEEKRNCFSLMLKGKAVRDDRKSLACVDSEHLMVYVAESGETRLNRLKPLPGREGNGPEPEAAALRDETIRYFDDIYAPPEPTEDKDVTDAERDMVAQRLQDLGYL